MKPLRRILIVNPYGIGDVLFVTPVLRALRLIPTVEKVDLILGSRTDGVVRSNPHVDEIFVIDKDLFHRQGPWRNFGDIRALTKRLQKNRYDLLLDYSQRPEYGFWAQFFLGIPVRSGFHYKHRGMFLTHRVNLEQGFQGRHVVDYYSEVAEKAGVLVEDRDLEFYIRDEDRQSADEFLKRKGISFQNFWVVAPGGGESWGRDAHFKRWPVRFFAEWIHRSLSQAKVEGLLIVGSPGERDLAADLQGRLSKPSYNIAGECSLSHTAALLEKAKLFAGNDGGLVHLAHALGTPLVAFYGPVDPEVYGPYPKSFEAVAVFKEGLECRPCYRNFRYKSDCSHRNCLQALEPSEAGEKIAAGHLTRV